VAFVDDYEFELDEVKFRLPQVTCINSTDLTGFLERDEMNPLYITEDSRVRRSMYQSDIIRKQVEESYTGTKEDFLASLGMKMTVSYAQENDLRRAEELTVRTHQLNSTGYTYSYDELKEFISSDNYKLLIVDLTDRYGYYGKIGLILLHCEKQVWTIKLLITSCRVMSRGIGKILLSLLVNISIDKGVKLLAEYIQNDRNRIMGVTYSLTGFHSCGDVGSKNMLEYTAGVKIPIPSYIEVEVEMQSAVGEMSYPVQV
jgi:FkbH-like protein